MFDGGKVSVTDEKLVRKKMSKWKKKKKSQLVPHYCSGLEAKVKGDECDVRRC